VLQAAQKAEYEKLLEEIGNYDWDLDRQASGSSEDQDFYLEGIKMITATNDGSDCTTPVTTPSVFNDYLTTMRDWLTW